MAITTFERSNEVALKIGQILADGGYANTASAPFFGQIIQAIRGALISEFHRLYEIANNVDIGRATGQYLDRWGVFLDEPREIPSYVVDMTLSNVYVYLDPDVLARAITINGSGIAIPKGTTISDIDETYEVSLIDDIYISSDRERAYARVMSTTPGGLSIPAGILTEVSYKLNQVPNIIPSSSANYILRANNVSDIVGGIDYADDETYRYVLQQKAQSVGVFNEARINTLMDLEEVINVHIFEYNGGTVVYIETRDVLLTEIVVEAARTTLRNAHPLGTPVQVYAPFHKRLKMEVDVEMDDDDFLQDGEVAAKTAVASYVRALRMGDSIDLQALVESIITSSDKIIGARIISATLGGRVLISSGNVGEVGVEFNEKIIAAEEDVTIS